jgi:ankyrin repeat protein
MGLVNKPDHIGMTPLHKAAFSGNRGCLEVLLQKGGHLSSLTHSGTSVLDAVFMHIARPYHFLGSMLDGCVQTNNISVLDRAFKVIIIKHNFKTLSTLMSFIFSIVLI